MSEDGAIGLAADNRPVAVYETPAGLVWRKFTGQISEPNINNAALWSAEAVISSDSIDGEPSLAGGPNGLFLFWKQGLPDRGYVSKFTGSGWTAPVLITGGQGFTSSDLSQDSSGRLHAVWSAASDDELRYTWSDDGVNWAPAADIARGEDNYRYVRVAAAGDHQGFATWNPDGPTVAAVALEALPSRPPDRAATRALPRRAA